MTKTDMGADTAQPADNIAWRHIWLANVLVDTGRQPLARVTHPELRPRKQSLSRRLQRLRYMRAILDGPRH
ncbi:MAG TPA: hypothetical protein VFL53_09270 [Pseudolabrys sp.]|nr:hypothetical protein [Pseudolabrys sp.]